METKLCYDLKSQFTLLIPTYNRHETLKKLLHYFKKLQVNFSILVLDSSQSSILEENKNLIENIPINTINIKHIIYSNDTEPFHKFSDGFQRVTTPFSGLCADDDIIFPDAIQTCIKFLLENPDYSLAHGLYCDFWQEKNEISIERLMYSSPSLDSPSSIHRICHLMQNYEATTYAVHRTEDAKIAFKKAAEFDNILFQELISSVLSVLHGKAARLPMFYSARNNERTNTYSLWHPLELISDSPEKLLKAYTVYRQSLLDTLETKNKQNPSQEFIFQNSNTRDIIDLAHLSYLSPFLKTDILNVILENHLKFIPKIQSSKIVWHSWAKLQSNSFSKIFICLYRLKCKLLPDFSFNFFIRRVFGRTMGEYIHNAQLPNAHMYRRYRISKNFQKQLSAYDNIKIVDIRELIQSLNNY